LITLCLEEGGRLARREGTESADPSRGLAVSGLTVRFGGLTALEDVSLNVEPAQIVGIIGPNGAGKTTLFNAICRFVPASDGRIEYRGRSLERVRPHQLVHMGVARTLQGLGLWDGLTVLENVMAGAEVHARAGFLAALLGLPRSDRDEDSLRTRARQALDRLDVADCAQDLPQSLPYGLQKRVAIARAVVAEPSLILLDEPASGLSENEIQRLGELLRELRQQTAIALVEHHMDFVMSICDRVVVLSFGRVVAAGTPDEVKANPEVTEAYLGQEAEAGGGDRVTVEADARGS
jgi:branched-chain amino acid transport system ATP-binding protein